MEVSIIVLTYNFDLNKLFNTLDSIIVQSKVTFEIIIADDGSKNIDVVEIQKYFEQKNFANYRCIFNIENKGTVQNYYSGLLEAKGEYVYAISPGDMLYDEMVIYDFYIYAKENDFSIIFGDAVGYSARTHKAIEIKNNPSKIKYFEKEITLRKLEFIFLFYNSITGVTFFRKRDIALESTRYILDVCKYMEDTSSCLYSIVQGYYPRHYTRKMVWYEIGAGISTNGQNKWKELLDRDLLAVYNKILNDYPDDKVLRHFNKMRTNRSMIAKAFISLRYPHFFIVKLLLKLKSDYKVIISEEDDEKLTKLLENKI